MTGRARRAPRPTQMPFRRSAGATHRLRPPPAGAPAFLPSISLVRAVQVKAFGSGGEPINEVTIALMRQHVLTDSSADARGPMTSADQVRDRAWESGSHMRSIAVDRAKQFSAFDIFRFRFLIFCDFRLIESCNFEFSQFFNFPFLSNENSKNRDSWPKLLRPRK